LEERPPSRRKPPPELSVTEQLDPPVDRVDAAAFVAKTLAEQLHERLAGHGLACTRLGINANTENGEELTRVWRCAEPLTPPGIADRVRWQLDGWLRGTSKPTAGVSVIRLEPVEVVEGHALQLDLWRGEGHAQAAERAGRALVHVQGLLGPEGVLTPVLGGGRGPAERVRLVPWGDERVPSADPDQPWPGRLPAPSPSTVPARPVAATVLDRRGADVEITERYVLTGKPCQVTVNGGRPRPVRSWAGPWPVEERWWDANPSRARIQVQLADGAALLLIHENRRWVVEGWYD
jgi:protein ImuB